MIRLPAVSFAAFVLGVASGCSLVFDDDLSSGTSVSTDGNEPVDRDADAGVDAPVEAAPASCVDTSCNPESCGRVGHSCLGGSCEAGACRPVRIATAPSPKAQGDWPIAARAGRISFGYVETTPSGAREGVVATIDASGGARVENARGAFAPARLFADDLWLYATTNAVAPPASSQLRRLPPRDTCATGAGSCVLATAAVANVGSVVSNGVEVVWSTRSDRRVRVVPVAGGATRLLAPNLTAPSELVVDRITGVVYVMEAGDARLGGAVQRLAPGAITQERVGGVQSPRDLAVDGASLYVATTEGYVFACPKAACVDASLRVLTTKLPGLQHVVEDAGMLFVTRSTGTGGSIDALLTDGSAAPIMLSTTPTEPRGIATDPSTIYWTDTEGSVWKLAK